MKRTFRMARFCMLRIGTVWRLESSQLRAPGNLHACAIQDRVLVGMNAIVMDGTEVGAGLNYRGRRASYERIQDSARIARPRFSGQSRAIVDHPASRKASRSLPRSMSLWGNIIWTGVRNQESGAPNGETRRKIRETGDGRIPRSRGNWRSWVFLTPDSCLLSRMSNSQSL